MATYLVEANGNVMGEYTASNRQQALEDYGNAAGYESYSVLSQQFGDDVTVTEIYVESLCDTVAKITGFTVFQDSYGDGVAFVHDQSYATYQELAGSIGKTLWNFTKK